MRATPAQSCAFALSLALAVFLASFGTAAETVRPVRPVRLVSGENPPGRFALGRAGAGRVIEAIVVRGHSNPGLTATHVFVSRFEIQATNDGVVNFARQVPRGGWPRESPESAGMRPSMTPDIWGPLWSMESRPLDSLPQALRDHLAQRSPPGSSVPYENVVYAFNLSAESQRRFFDYEFVRFLPTLKTHLVDDSQERFVGSLTYREGCDKCPGLVLWGGSGGPVPAETVAYYANRGIAVLSIQYFTSDPNQTKPWLTLWIRRTPLEIFSRAIEWLKRRPEADPERIAIMGGSRGGEAALLVGTKYGGKLAGVVAQRPHYASMSSALNGNTPIPLIEPETCAWTWESACVPYAPVARERPNQGINELAEKTGGVSFTPEGFPVVSVLPAFADVDRRLRARGPAIVESVRIPVETIRAPIYANAGEKDAMWIAPRAIHMIRVARRSSSLPRELRVADLFHIEPGAGHVSGLPGAPTMEGTRIWTPGSYLDAVREDGSFVPTKSIWILGGDPEANHRGHLRFTRNGLRFLERVYKQRLPAPRLQSAMQ